MTDKILIITTVGSHSEARNIARALVEGKLAACVNIVPAVDSIYRWQEKVEEAQEWMLLIKTVATAFERVRAKIESLHAYQLPECICVQIENGSAAYLHWIGESVE
ncbi:MAG: divalent-cation tolerance protein CutA [Acidobacteriales bacterium]|nr:divalent-cation tolerance protein CutA [Terriglobales bacterium]